MKKHFSDELISSFLREAEAGVSARDLCRKHAISDATLYTWRKKLLGEAMLDKEALQVTPLTTDQKQDTVELMCDATGLSELPACRLTGLSLSTCRYDALRPSADAYLSGRVTELALERRRFGYRRIWSPVFRTVLRCFVIIQRQ